MKIDWKKVSQSTGYRSLKAAYEHDIRKRYQTKRELLIKFRWVIGRAQHYAHHQNRAIEEILNEWESKRDYWWLNYYQDCNQPKLIPKKNRLHGPRYFKKYYRRIYGARSPKVREHSLKNIQRSQQERSTKSPKRWTKDQREWRDKHLRYR